MIHRLANDPPSGIPSGDRKLSLCGRYIHHNYLTIVEERVQCQTCRKSATSQRTIERDRIAVGIHPDQILKLRDTDNQANERNHQ